ncbi:hypothetical protein TrVE_jg5912 [Triparma verrucosa]|uniref:Uncharacterized protein n=1 Tax=Triparma verrucosa TaxID=1606542 RepID=A0A9W7F4Q4_9STRA|nr:hypothetical protein TrVE_jg5912 [Triparma verrucosa]
MDSGRESGRASVRLSIADGARRLSLAATEQASLAAEQASLAVSNWLTSLRDFMLESAGYALLASLLPLFSILCNKQAGYDQSISEFYEEGSRFDPPILKDGNITVVPYDSHFSSEYYVDNVGNLSTAVYLSLIMYCFFNGMPCLLRARVMLRPQNKGIILGAAITGFVVVVTSIALIHSYKGAVQTGKIKYNSVPVFVFLLTFIMPLVFVAAQVWTKNTLKKKWTKATHLKWYVVIVLALLLESTIATIFVRFILPTFFRSSTTTKRVLIRTLSPIIFLKIGIGVGWKLTVFIKEKTNCDLQSVTVGFISFYCVVIPTLNRLMQGSARSVSEGLIFEVAGTVSELVTADSLLQGITPWDSTLLKYMCKSNKPGDAKEANTKVQPEGVEMAGQTSTKEDRRQWKIQFCETTMHLLMLSEALALLISSYFWLLMRANPGDPGSPAIPVSQTLTNMGIMLFGELVVTDGIIGYASHKFQRYSVDLPLSWSDFKTSRRHRLLYVTVIMSMYASCGVINFPVNLCYTSLAEDELNWALTSCPAFPKNITEMSRVGELYGG